MSETMNQSPVEITASSVNQEFAIDRIESAWADVSASTLTLTSETMRAPDPQLPSKNLEIKAVHNSSAIYLYFKWSDSSNSMSKKRWTFSGGSWSQSLEEEDRLGVIWYMGQTPTMMQQRSDSRVPVRRTRSMSGSMTMNGCQQLCHIDPDDSSHYIMSTSKLGGTVDLWHWKSSRSSPVGYADDQYLDTVKRKNDDGTATFTENISGVLPAFMFSGGTGNSTYLLKSEAIAFDGNQFTEGDTLPGYTLGDPTGDRASVEAYGVWSNNTWQVVLKRSLTTSSAQDVQLSAASSVYLGIALFDNAANDQHIKSPLIQLSLE